MRWVRSRFGGAAGILTIGFVLIVLAHLARPLGSLPLFDGVISIEPYRYLDPPAPAPGATPYPSDPTSFSQPIAVKNGKIPPVFIATTENPPQAQMFSSGPVFDVPAGTTSVVGAVGPVRSSVPPPNGVISGNVYHFSVATPDGTEVPISAGKSVSIVLRIPLDEATVTIDWFDGQRWQPQATDPLGVPTLYKTNATQLGDYALVVPGQGPTPAPLASGQTPGPAPTAGARTPATTPSSTAAPPVTAGSAGFSVGLALVSVVIAGVVVGLAAAGLYFWRSRR